MNKYNSNLKYTEWLKQFRGGDDTNVPICRDALEDIKFIIKLCREYNVPQPTIRPWSGGDGVQVEWNRNGWYIEIESSSKGIGVYLENEADDTEYIECSLKDIYGAFLLVREFLRRPKS